VVCTTLQGEVYKGKRWRTRAPCFQSGFGTSREVQSVSCKPLSCKHGVEKNWYFITRRVCNLHVVPRFCPWDGNTQYPNTVGTSENTLELPVCTRVEMNRTCTYITLTGCIRACVWNHAETWLWHSVKMRNSYCTISTTNLWAYTKHPVASVLTFYPIPNWFCLHQLPSEYGHCRWHSLDTSTGTGFDSVTSIRSILGGTLQVGGDAYRSEKLRWPGTDSNAVDADFFSQKFANLENMAPR
jgi:hypothetical protein